MKPTFVQIIVDQAAAIRAGFSQYGSTIIEADPSQLTPAQREELLRCPSVEAPYDLARQFGGATCFSPYSLPADSSGRRLPLPPVADASMASLALLLDARPAAIEAAQAEKAAALERAIQAALDTPPEEWVRADGSVSVPGIGYRDEQAAHADPRIQDRLREVAPLAAARKAEIQAAAERAKARQAAEEQARQAAEARREQQIADWVAEFGTPSQRKRFQADLLPEKEVIDGMRAAAFAPIEHLPRYKKITAAEVIESDGYDDDAEVKFRVFDLEEATEEEFEMMERVSDLLPAAQMTLREHVGSSADAEIRRRSLKVTLRVGEFEFSRELAVESPTDDDADAS